MRSVLKRYAVGGAAVVLFLGIAAQGVAAERSGEPTAQEKQTLQAGLQVAPKGGAAARKAAAHAANPYLANVEDATAVDWAYWRSQLAAKSRQRAADTSTQERSAADRKAAGRGLSSPLLHDELEPSGTAGSNDTQDAAEPINGFGTRKKQNPRLRILGELADLAPTPTEIPTGAEDNGSLPLATDTGIGASRKAMNTTGVLG
ncbi:MAG: hypothetical protein ACRDQB_12595, partial [Thermocrispum sp.]